MNKLTSLETIKSGAERKLAQLMVSLGRFHGIILVSGLLAATNVKCRWLTGPLRYESEADVIATGALGEYGVTLIFAETQTRTQV